MLHKPKTTPINIGSLSAENSYQIRYGDREVMPGLLKERAQLQGLSVEQLVRRLVSEGMRDFFPQSRPIEGHSLEDFLIKNNVLKSLC